MNIEQFIAYCLEKPGVEDTYPFKGEMVWMKVMGKLFAMTNVIELKIEGEMVSPFHLINVKCDPEHALELRESHGAIRPGWHQSKVHWNSLYMDGTLEDRLILELVDHSYELVVQSLPKKVQKELNAPPDSISESE